MGTPGPADGEMTVGFIGGFSSTQAFHIENKADISLPIENEYAIIRLSRVESASAVDVTINLPN